MNADDTRLIDSEETLGNGKNKKKKSDKTYMAGTVVGAAAVGVAAGTGAHAVYGASPNAAGVDENIDLEGVELAGGFSAAHQSVGQPTAEAQPNRPVEQPSDVSSSEPEEEPIEPITEETAGSDSSTEEVVETLTADSDPVEPVNPEENIETPDVEEILSGEQIDTFDIEAEEIFAFDGMETVYTVDGEELTAASFHLENGFEGVMIDVDGDGVFDDVAAMTSDGLVRIGDAPMFTVDDVELELNPNDSYLAQNDEIDHTLADDSFTDDIIDVSLA